MWAAPPGAAESEEAQLSLDLKDADATQVVALLAEAAGKQPVFDPGITCRLTLRVKETPWRSALAAVLRACSLGVEESGSVLRIAPVSRLTAEETARRSLATARAERESGIKPLPRFETVRLAHARAAELAPLLQKLFPGSQVSYDVRSNTLIITY